jgi:hypothetical protein
MDSKAVSAAFFMLARLTSGLCDGWSLVFFDFSMFAIKGSGWNKGLLASLDYSVRRFSMPRKPRIEYPGALYHVIARGNVTIQLPE